MENSFLWFTKDWPIKRIAYAASFGKDIWQFTGKENQKCKDALKLFNAVSVRERNAVEMIKVNWDIDARLVLDPTLLLTAEHYIRLSHNNNTPPSRGDLLVYILDANKIKSEF